MYEEPNESMEKMIQKAHNLLVNNTKYIHPLDIESLLKEINAEYEESDLNTPYHKQYYPYLRGLLAGIKKVKQKEEVDEKRRQRVREYSRRRMKAIREGKMLSEVNSSSME